MRHADTERLTLDITEERLRDGRYMSFASLAGMVRKYEESHSVPGKKLQIKLYNSLYGGKYPVMEMYGVRFVDTKTPVKPDASLVIEFYRGGKE